jgi:membrane-associated phospholipid phosphatase
LSSIRASLVCVVTVIYCGVSTPALAQAPPAPAGAPLGLFTTTLNDFRRLPSEESLTWLVIGGTIAAASHTADRNVSDGFSAARVGGMFGAGETMGGARAQLAGALATYAVGGIAGQPRVASVGGDLIRAQILAQAMTAGIKLSVRRGRPDGGEFSFPSGHTSVTFATATVLQRHFGWKAGVPAYALASYVAASRVHVKRHYLSDVAFGAAVGMIAGRTVTVGRGGARFALSPAVSANHAGVSFTLLDKR